jgi:tRNA modification GTPase
MDGLLSSKVNLLRKRLIDVSSFVELELDFAEEKIEFVRKDELFGKINEILVEIEDLLESYSFGKVIRDGINVAIVGEPNVGKSSLLNYLLKESRAIVSDIPGTTRDIIREEISIDGYLFKLHDTAGIRISEEEIEKEGVLRSRETVKNADLVLFVGDVDVGFSESLGNDLYELNQSAKIVKILNKIDIGGDEKLFADFKISAKTGDGMTQFLDGLLKVVLQEGTYTEKSAIVTNIRHYDCLVKAKKNLMMALETLSEKLSGEYLASDFLATQIALSEIIGEVTPEEVLSNIFSKFCIGK